ncbi:MOSC N-terminal beta barrel domain-containing protein [Xylariomycetidae sp. FL2044]|nr:MOSC N-terminal beta barrel domain-containing protein [Xylariomycetidae sp. FL2044]
MVDLHSLNPFATKVRDRAVVSDLRIYPIKSCRGFSVSSSYLTRKGLDLDRNWMFVAPRDGKTPKFVTIRDMSELTLVDTALASASGQPAGVAEDDLQLVISLRHHPEKRVMLPARPTREWLEANTKCETVDIWENETDAWAYRDEVNSLFRDFLNRDVKLVYKGPTPRVLRGNGAPEHLGREESTNFPDVLPVLIANEASLRELNGRLKARGSSEITIERFRPNIVVESAQPWSEDDWKTVRIVNGDPGPSGLLSSRPSAIDIDVQAHCARCQVPNVDPETAQKNAHEPWDTLVSYRRIDEGIKWKPCFGMLSCPRNEGAIRVGMPLEVTEQTQSHVYIKGF